MLSPSPRVTPGHASSSCLSSLARALCWALETCTAGERPWDVAFKHGDQLCAWPLTIPLLSPHAQWLFCFQQLVDQLYGKVPPWPAGSRKVLLLGKRQVEERGSLLGSSRVHTLARAPGASSGPAVLLGRGRVPGPSRRIAPKSCYHFLRQS